MTAGEIVGWDIRPDKLNSPCAACGHVQLAETRGMIAPINIAGTRQPIRPEGSQPTMLMLCMNAGACCARYRRGRTAAQYASMLRNATHVRALREGG